MTENWHPRGCKHYIDEAAGQLGIQDDGNNQPVGQASILAPVRRIEALIGQAYEYRDQPDIARRALDGAEAHMKCLALAFEASGAMIDEAKLEILNETHVVDESDPANAELVRLVREVEAHKAEIQARDETILAMQAQILAHEAKHKARHKAKPKAPAEPEGADVEGDEPQVANDLKAAQEAVAEFFADHKADPGQAANHPETPDSSAPNPSETPNSSPEAPAQP